MYSFFDNLLPEAGTVRLGGTDKDVIVEHRHWKTGKSQKDATYDRHTKDGKSLRYANDRAVINKFERYFHADVLALKNVMR